MTITVVKVIRSGFLVSGRIAFPQTVRKRLRRARLSRPVLSYLIDNIRVWSIYNLFGAACIDLRLLAVLSNVCIGSLQRDAGAAFCNIE